VRRGFNAASEALDGAKIRRIGATIFKIIPLRELSMRRMNTAPHSMQQKRHHMRGNDGLPAAHIAPVISLEIEALRTVPITADMAFGTKVLHVRRQEQCLIDIPGRKYLS